MIDIQEYLDSGIIEKYCLGLATSEEARNLAFLCTQYPKVRGYLVDNQKTLEAYIARSKRVPKSNAKSIILKRLENLKLKGIQLNHQYQLPEFISLSQYSDVDEWQEVIRSVQPTIPYDNIHVQPLFDGKGQKLHLIWVKQGIPREVHPHLEERFLILEGTATCHINGVDHFLESGSFMQMPLEEHHQITVTSKIPVKAIFSRVKTA